MSVLVRYMSINIRVPKASPISHTSSSVPVLSTHWKIIIHCILPVWVVAVATVDGTLCWRWLHSSSVSRTVSKHVAGLTWVVMASVQTLLLHPCVIICHPRGDLGLCWLRGIRRSASNPPTESRGERGGSWTVRKILHCFSKFGLKTEISVSVCIREWFWSQSGRLRAVTINDKDRKRPGSKTRKCFWNPPKSWSKRIYIEDVIIPFCGLTEIVNDFTNKGKGQIGKIFLNVMVGCCHLKKKLH